MEDSYDKLEKAIMNGQAVYTVEEVECYDDASYPSLVSKLQACFMKGAFSPKMVAITGRLVGQKWTDPEVIGLAIDSSGMVSEAMGGFLGSASDFDHNLKLVVEAAELNGAELRLMRRLANLAVDRWDGKTCLPDVDVDDHEIQR